MTGAEILEDIGMHFAPDRIHAWGPPNTLIDLPITRDLLAEFFERWQLDVGAEIGVLEGAYSETLLTANPRLHLLAVDPWVAYDGYPDFRRQEELSAYEQTALARLRPFGTRCRVMRTTSAEAARSVPLNALDFVYIDGNHLFDYVMEDLIVWSRRVRPGGIVAGHDFVRRRAGRKYGPVHVVEAVSAYLRFHPVPVMFTMEGRPNGAQPRSWFWVKGGTARPAAHVSSPAETSGWYWPE